MTDSPSPAAVAKPDNRPGLTRVEQVNVGIVERWHSVQVLSSVSTWLARNVARRQYEMILRNILADYHFERLSKANYDNGILICANHRSYIDNFSLAIRSMRYIPPHVRLLAPARTEGLFDKPWGIVLNFFLTYMNMYPPVVRSSRGAVWGKRVIQILTDLLHRGRIAIFIHPEGGRNKGSDPYDLLPAKPGLGKIIHSTRCEVFPVFLQGFPREPKKFLRANYSTQGKKEPLVHAVMGESIDFSAERAQPASPEIYREIGRRLMNAIVQASIEERQIRAALNEGSARNASGQVVSAGSTEGR